ncbi:hypothetical protein WJR50_32580 [Catalinimonas sp. 4WD22]|uniref:HD domain-containing protein n=1 Tax=Catalinimonas locisalis TaxID=3133978 RepID=UPI00310158CA
MDNLRIIWHELSSKYSSNTKLVESLWEEIEKSYTDKKRHYHNLAHLAYMIGKAMECKDKLADLDTLLFSIFYHDIIYSTKRKDNEEKSAEVAQNRLTSLGVPTSKTAKCQQQILATKHHQDNNDSDTNYLVDFDLAILGESLEKYHDYAKKIRKEYSMYPDFLYKKGRKKALQHFLAMEVIFKTAEFRNDYEQQARENLKIELQQL